MDYTIKNEFLTVVVRDDGAELQSIKTADGTEYLWQADKTFWDDKAPNIFPYVARMTEGKYTADGEGFEMKIHGFLKYMKASMETQSENSITFRLDSCEGTKKQYPYDFTYRIIYTLEGNKLLTTSSVENKGSRRMYFGLGGHPGFNVPLEEGLGFEDYYLEFDRASHPYRVGFTPSCFLTGHDDLYPLQDDVRMSLHHDMFNEDAIVLKHAPHKVTLASAKGTRSVTVEYPDFPYIGFWHRPNSEAPYVCIEPWSSLPSRDGIVEELSQQSDLIGLAVGKTYETTWTIEIK